jgi:Methyltransferase domain
MYYLDFLRSVHDALEPQHYLEIGVASGKSLALSRCRSVGIDPGFHIDVPIDGNFALHRTSSDEYFTRPDPLASTGGEPFDLAFIDGLHLFEFAFRDFINTERHMRPNSLVIFDDVLPRSVDEAARERHTLAWTGDVYPILEVLARYRPELSVIPVDTQPTGLLLIMGLDPASTVLRDSYDEIIAEFRHPDPQPVPDEVTDRLTVLPAQRVVESGVLEELAGLKGAGVAEVQARLAKILPERLGAAYAPRTSAVNG